MEETVERGEAQARREPLESQERLETSVLEETRVTLVDQENPDDKDEEEPLATSEKTEALDCLDPSENAENQVPRDFKDSREPEEFLVPTESLADEVSKDHLVP